MAFPQQGFDNLPTGLEKGNWEKPLPLDKYLTQDGKGNELFAQYCIDYLTPVIIGLIGREHPGEVKNLVQEATIKAVLGLGKFNEESKLTTWLNRIGTNTVIDFLRKVKTRKEDPLDLILKTKNIVDPLTRVNDFENTDLIKNIFKGLNEEEKQILKLFYVEEKSYEEIAEILEKPLGTVKNKIFRAKEKAKKYAQSKGYVN